MKLNKLPKALHAFFSPSHLALRIGLQTTVFRELNDHAIWRQGSVVATDIDHLFTPYSHRWWEKKHHLGAGVGALKMRSSHSKIEIKSFVLTLIKVFFN